MRIISGKYKGKRLVAPGNLPARPTTDFAKEALFNLLSNRYFLDDVAVLDLFTGTGNISFEFASRGAQQITAVDSHNGSVRFIRKTAEDLGFDDLYAIRGDAFRFIKDGRGKYDIIFCDPPYELPKLETLPDLILESGMLKEDGLLVIEHGMHTSFEEHPQLEETRKYSSVNFSFFTQD
jgi:16S rRNA (guanine(966)-N(2))-methyltransferase RsmD